MPTTSARWMTPAVTLKATRPSSHAMMMMAPRMPSMLFSNEWVVPRRWLWPPLAAFLQRHRDEENLSRGKPGQIALPGARPGLARLLDVRFGRPLHALGLLSALRRSGLVLWGALRRLGHGRRGSECDRHAEDGPAH